MAKLPNRTLKIVLVASLALNLLVVGALAGFFGSGRHKEPRVDGFQSTDIRPDRGQRGGPQNSFLWPVLADLDRGERRAFAKVIGKTLAAQGLTREAAREQSVAIATAIAAEPFDADALSALFQLQAEGGQKRIQVTQNAVLGMLKEMSPQARTNVAKRIIDGRRGKPGGPRRNP